jgi:hypothetical protein
LLLRGDSVFILVLPLEVRAGLFDSAHGVLESFLLAAGRASWLGKAGRLLVSTYVGGVLELTVSLSRVV